MPYPSSTDLKAIDDYSAFNRVTGPDDVPALWRETMAAGFQLSMDEERSDSFARAWRPHLDERVSQIAKLGGDPRLAERYVPDDPRVAYLSSVIDNQGAGEARRQDPVTPSLVDAIIQQREFAKAYPGIVKSDVEISTLIAADLAERRDANEATLARGGAFPAFIGSTGAFVTDPLILATAPFGPGAQVGRGALVRAAQLFKGEAAIAVATEVPIQMQVAQFKAEIDSPWTFQDAAFNVVAASVGAGAIRGGGSLTIDATKAVLDKYRKLPRTVRTEESEQAAEILERIVELDEQNPLKSEQIGPDGEGFVDTVGNQEAMTLARAQAESGEPVNVREIVQGTEPATPLDTAGRGLTHDNVALFSPDDLTVDAKRFQFKGEGDASGVTASLKGVDEFDQSLSGQVLAWEDAGGTQFIVDGHQRLALAKRALAGGQNPDEVRLSGFVLREADGVTDIDAMRVGAVRNLTAATGSALDAAKVLRGIGPAGEVALPPLPPTSALLRQGRFIARLDDEAFNAVVNDAIPQRYAAIIGELIADGKQQRAAIDALKKLNPPNSIQARAMVEQIRAAGFSIQRTDDLFGSQEIAKSLIKERAQVLDAVVKSAKDDKRTFGTLVSRGTDIEEAGANKLDSKANQLKVDESGQAIEIITRVANQKGEVSDALSKAAGQVAKGKKPADVAELVLDAVRRITDGGDTAGKPAKPVRPTKSDESSVESAKPINLNREPGRGLPDEGSLTGYIPDDEFKATMAEYENLIDETGDMIELAKTSIDENGQVQVELIPATKAMDELEATEKALNDIEVCAS